MVMVIDFIGSGLVVWGWKVSGVGHGLAQDRLPFGNAGKPSIRGGGAGIVRAFAGIGLAASEPEHGENTGFVFLTAGRARRVERCGKQGLGIELNGSKFRRGGCHGVAI